MAVLTIDPLDPLALAIAPPKDESPADRWAREQREAQARLISDQIDAQIKAERAALRKRGKPIKVLLLGQSESGKSTTVKNFQLAYAYSSFIEERSAWRAVIHLNLVRSVNTILDTLSKELSLSQQNLSQPLTPRPFRTSTPTRSVQRPTTSQSQITRNPSVTSGTVSLKRPPRPNTSYISGSHSPSISSYRLVEETDADGDDDDATSEHHSHSLSGSDSSSLLTDTHRVLQLRLAPLRYVQRDLERSLGAATTEAPAFAGDAAPWLLQESTSRPKEFFITSRNGWKAALRRVKSGYQGAMRRASLGSRDEARLEVEDEGRKKRSRRKTRPESPFAFSYSDKGEDALDGPERASDEGEGMGEGQAQSAAEVIASCAEDMAALWADREVQTVLTKRKVKAKLEEGSGFFLDDVARIAARDYEPSDQDVVKARLRTMGVQEYRFKFERGSEAGREWILYDVGGARSSRHAWAPYFDDINAIIFLAPISCFDERLAEDRRVNRLQDSLLIWKGVCSSKLLRNVQLILFLNKCDLLEKKLSRGVRVAKYVPSYGDRPNEAKDVAKYFRHQFKDVLIKQSPEQRPFYSYPTSVIDTKATAVTVATVRDGIQRNYMKDADIL